MKRDTKSNIMLAFIIASASILCFAAGEYNADEELSRLRKELAQVQTEQQRTKQDAIRDQQEEQIYVQRTKLRIAASQSETDSVNRQIALVRRSADSLAAIAGNLQSRQRQYELLQNSFRDQLKNATDRILGIAETLPPMVSNQIVSSITFLKSEIAAKSTDNVEAMQRLCQIIRDINEASMSIQDAQGQSPAAEIKTTANRLRIGCIFEAASDEKGAIAALWQGRDNNGNPQWKIIKETMTSKAVADAVAMRQGKALPAIVLLPFSSPVEAGGAP
jgi:hypothetical protein